MDQILLLRNSLLHTQKQSRRGTSAVRPYICGISAFSNFMCNVVYEWDERERLHCGMQRNDRIIVAGSLFGCLMFFGNLMFLSLPPLSLSSLLHGFWCGFVWLVVA